MPSLLDVAPLREKVKLAGGLELECKGLSLEAIAYVLSISPELRQLITDGVWPDPMVLLTRVPAAANAILAAGTGNLGDAEYEAAAGNLIVEDQIDLIGAIFRLTFPGGFMSFFERVGQMGQATGLIRPPLRNGEDVAGREPDTSSPPLPTS